MAKWIDLNNYIRRDQANEVVAGLFEWWESEYRVMLEKQSGADVQGKVNETVYKFMLRELPKMKRSIRKAFESVEVEK